MGAAAGAVWWFTTVLCALMAVCLGDWWLHFDNVSQRIWLGAGMLLLASVAAGLLIVRPWMRRYGDLELARQIERIQPGWGGSLASSVEFIEAGCDPRLGAPTLQRSVVNRAGGALSQAELDTLVSTQPLVIAAGSALLSCLAAAAIVVGSPDRAALALERLLFPSTAAEWPREHTLVLLDHHGQPLPPPTAPIESARGEPVTLFIEDVDSELPEDAVLHIAHPDGERETIALRRTTLDGRNGRETTVGFAVLPAVTDSVSVKATGGDDRRMPWYTYRFSPRPAIEQLTITTTDPDYLGGDVSERTAETGSFEGLVGSHVRIDVEANTPLAAARLCRDGESPQNLQLHGDRKSFHVEFQLDEAARFSYWFELTARSGLKSTIADRFEVVAVVDQPPVVAILQPAHDVTVTPVARLPLSIDARDNHEIVRMRLAVSELPGSAEDHYFPLSTPADVSETRVDSTLEIAEFELAPGRELSVRAEAFDANANSGREPGRSEARIVRIVAAEEKLRELQSRQKGIAQSLQSARSMQSQAVQQTRELVVQWQAAGEFLVEDVDRIKRIRSNQQRLTERLFDERNGVVDRAQEILSELDWNGIADQPTALRLNQLVDQLTRLRTEALPATENSLTFVRKALSTEAEVARRDVEQELINAERSQTAALETLDSLAALFSEWQRQFDVIRRAAEIHEEQEKLHQESIRLGQQTLTTPFDSLPAQLQADLLRLAEREEQLSRQIERLDEQLSRMAADSDADRATVAREDLRDALALLRDRRIKEEMQRAAHLLAENEVIDSAETQKQLLESLEELEEILRGLGVPSPDTLLSQIEAAETELESLRERQEETLRKAREIAESGPSHSEQLEQLRREQEQLARQTEEFAQRLRRQQLGDSASIGSRAARTMRQAAVGLQDEAVPPDVLAKQQDAVDDLLQAQRELSAMRQRIMSARTGAQIAEVSAMLESCIERQQGLAEETTRLDQARQARGNLTRAQLQTLHSTAEAQAQLQGDVRRLAETVEDALVFREVLRLAADEMSAAAELLSDRKVDGQVQQIQQAALTSMQGVLESLQEVESRREVSPGATTDQNESGSSGWSVISQVRLVLSMQKDVARRTAELIESAGEADELSPAEDSQRERLEQQQARLRSLLSELLQAQADAVPTDEPTEVTP